jgi:anaerobic ribonucleoside-triphosphate reductase activating protein
MSELLLNVAATCVGTRMLGPGLRSVVWVQGCAFRCPGCISPEWLPQEPRRQVSPEALAEELLALPGVDGLTISGGEPMLQARGLTRLVLAMRSRRAVDVICFSGYRYEVLRNRPPSPFVGLFLEVIDLLVDGPYVAGLNDNHGMRGSSNQRFITFGPRLRGVDLESLPRRIEYQVSDGQLMMVGVPPRNIPHAVECGLVASRPEEALHVGA